jgi:hypothetical protein
MTTIPERVRSSHRRRGNADDGIVADLQRQISDIYHRDGISNYRQPGRGGKGRGRGRGRPTSLPPPAALLSSSSPTSATTAAATVDRKEVAPLSTEEAKAPATRGEIDSLTKMMSLMMARIDDLDPEVAIPKGSSKVEDDDGYSDDDYIISPAEETAEFFRAQLSEKSARPVYDYIDKLSWKQQRNVKEGELLAYVMECLDTGLDAEAYAACVNRIAGIDAAEKNKDKADAWRYADSLAVAWSPPAPRVMLWIN